MWRILGSHAGAVKPAGAILVLALAGNWRNIRHSRAMALLDEAGQTVESAPHGGAPFAPAWRFVTAGGCGASMGTGKGGVWQA
jgi:hypothetical protein